MISLRKTHFILKESQKGELSNHQIRKLAKVSKSTAYRRIKSFTGLSAYFIKKELMQRRPPGRAPDRTPMEHAQRVIAERIAGKSNDRTIARTLKQEGIEISHYKVYNILKSAGLIHMLKEKRKRKKWVRWARKHSLSLWQTDWTTFQDKQLIVILDDASRLVVGWGLFDHATSENSVEVLKKAIEKHGKPKAFLTGRDTQFFASSKDGEPAGETYFQQFLKANGIKHILARVNHPQTCGKIERFFGEVKKRIITWKDFATVEEVVEWHNKVKPHMSLSDDERLVTPVQAFAEKLHHKARIIKTFKEVG
ncbi:MAG: DDE-type integrase/transposase/recombinase [Candidatus Micrarchaeota archaeon]